MKFTDAQLRDFKALYHTHFSEDLSDDEAAGKARELIGLVRHFYKPREN